jgi:EmrB/QacA subfamily drug resistance transporter
VTSTIEDPRRRLVVLTAVCAALAAVQTSVAALNVALPDIGAQFGASQSALLWVLNGYTLTLAALLLPFGAIGDRVGRKRMLLAGLGLFLLATLASSRADSVSVLIALRVVTGIGGAMVLPSTLSVITASFPPELKERAVAVWAAVAGAGGLLGMVGAAFVVDAVTWPWVFALTLVPGALALVLVVTSVPDSVERGEGRFDVVGAVLSTGAIGGLVLGIQEGPERGWTHPFTVAALAVGIASLLVWIATSARIRHPLLDLRLFRLPRLTAGSIALLALSGLSFGVFLLVIQYTLSVLGFSAVRSAASVAPIILCTVVGAQAGPRLSARFGPGPTVGGGLLIAGVGLAATAFRADALSLGAMVPGLVVFGLGLGLGLAPSTTAITDSLPLEKQGVASAVNDSVRELGGALGIAVMGSLLSVGYRSSVADLVASLTPDVGAIVRHGIVATQVAMRSFPVDVGGPILLGSRDAFVDGWALSMWVGAGLLIAAGAVTMFLFRQDRQPAPAGPTPAIGAPLDARKASGS